MTIGRNVVVIGAGNTAIDCATIARRLGAERVTMVYRRTEREMTAYPHEYEFVEEGRRRISLPHAAGARAETETARNGVECVRDGAGRAGCIGPARAAGRRGLGVRHSPPTRS